MIDIDILQFLYEYLYFVIHILGCILKRKNWSIPYFRYNHVYFSLPFLSACLLWTKICTLPTRVTIACIIFYIVPFHKNILLLLACFTNTSSIKIKFNDKTKTNIKHIVWVQYAHHTILRSITIYCSYYNTTLC